MRTVILHVGMHKTGSTSIQQSLRGLARSGVRYVDLGSANHTIPIRAAFAPRADAGMLRILGLRSTGELQALRQATLARLDHELSAGGFERFVISGEGISLLPPPSVAQLRAALLKHVDRVQVCAYVREPVGFSGSALQEYIKNGHVAQQVPQPKYRARYAKFIEAFGADHFAARVFAPDRLRNGSVVQDFCAAWGIPFDPRHEVRANESLSEPAVKLLQLLNRLEPAAPGSAAARWARPRLVQAIAARFEGSFRLPPAFQRDAVDPDDLQWLYDNCGIDFRATPVADAPRAEDFRSYLDRIEPEVVEAYREFLAGQGVRAGPADGAAELLRRHYRACERSLPVRWQALRARLLRGGPAPA